MSKDETIRELLKTIIEQQTQLQKTNNELVKRMNAVLAIYKAAGQ
ncbi:hypothetical protein CLV78_105215 [Aliiruegeria haliotis]|uniref:Uncharacterized protein n=1 Tax=Aliiruegeria haliotis TaxID=1280846 RepID=A0A2T0RPS9_9RHOB|nr:hypothetical protein CLV78_105215 [Aliiruegeria haliotis]